ncbi:bifunctional AP-4-A phosphorylase/ADP sulfurylase [Gnomoniopsis smithogilvyi]|uniref:Bifunctional AP-4-A phosphorylase/ADP sulfurylase n=1 Tax=Gnomoniopsis smithogilvyi TaxID=1191159 RepID=A0A9W8YRG6_9PEZI|nr:bifunctional AP-4-A phosphorylase/ADP sulfurylase [Gnomoniopsis smithogilvyi]
MSPDMNTLRKEEMSPVKVPANLPDLVRATFNKAKANGDVNFYPTQVAVLTPASTPFQLRFSPSLANKPKAPPSSSSPSSGHEKKKPFNPFENPPPQLTVSPIGPSHTLVLNKFAIVPEHAILITRTFKPQTHLLEADDLAATHACIRAYHDCPTEGKEREELFAFFNCGDHSGASQPHRHLQLLPVTRMRDGLAYEREEHAAWSVLANRLTDPVTDNTRLPFATFAEKLSLDMQAEELHAVYRRLYRRACNAAKVGAVGMADEELFQGEAKISYNLAMTKDAMVVCPRTAEGSSVLDREGRDVGKLSLNGTLLAGTALVKSEDEWNVLRNDPEQLWKILGSIGIPSEDASTES